MAALSLTIAAGQASGSVDFTLTPTDDEVDEPDETISVDGTLSGVAVAPAAITLEDNDELPVVTLVLTPPSISEGGGATSGTSTVTATMDRASSEAVALTVSAAAVSPAVAGDFTQAGSALTIAAGSRASAGTVTLAAVDDDTVAEDKEITVSAAASGGRGVSDPSPVILVITDDDEVPTAMTLSVDTDTAEPGLQDTVVERGGAAVVRVIATFEGPARFTTAQTVTVAVGKAGDSAAEGRDYEAVADLALTIQAREASGSTEFTLTPIIDGINEPSETISVEGTLSGVTVTPAAITLHNSNDPLPRGWLARFGRTVAEQLMESIENRMNDVHTPGFQGRLAGETLSFAEPDDPGDTTRERLRADTGMNRPQDSWAIPGVDHGGTHWEDQSPTSREALADGAFSYVSGDPDGASVAIWGRMARSGFDGREGWGSLDGEVTTGLLGIDWTGSHWDGGFVISRSQGKGDYALEEGLGGAADSTLTALAPWVSFEVRESLTLWGIAGYGEGDLTFTPESGPAVSADIDWLMAAIGAKGELVEAEAMGGFALNLKADGLWVRTRSERTAEMREEDADVTRLRLGLEGSWTLQQEDGGLLMPMLEVGIRHDDGDAETGFSVEVGGGITWVAPELGLDLNIEGRSLVIHEDGFRDWGYAASLAFDPDPSSQQGLSLKLSQERGGSASGGVDALFADGAPEQGAAEPAGGNWQAEMAYGFALPGGRFTGIPYLVYAHGQDSREYTLGWQIAPAPGEDTDLFFNLEAMRREDAGTRAEHEIRLELQFSW